MTTRPRTAPRAGPQAPGSAAETATGIVVRESGGGASDVPCAYRIVGRRPAGREGEGAAKILEASDVVLLAEDVVHDLRALGERGPDLVSVDQFRGRRPVMASEQRDAL